MAAVFWEPLALFFFFFSRRDSHRPDPGRGHLLKQATLTPFAPSQRACQAFFVRSSHPFRNSPYAITVRPQHDTPFFFQICPGSFPPPPPLSRRVEGARLGAASFPPATAEAPPAKRGGQALSRENFLRTKQSGRDELRPFVQRRGDFSKPRFFRFFAPNFCSSPISPTRSTPPDLPKKREGPLSLQRSKRVFLEPPNLPFPFQLCFPFPFL